MAGTSKLRIARRKPPVDSSGSGTPGISPTDIAAHNSRAALELLRRLGPLTRLELSAQLQLTEPAIAGIMARLMDAGHVDQRKRTGSGRYVSREYMLVSESAYAIGVQLTVAGGRAVLLDLAGVTVDTRRFFSPAELGTAVAILLHSEELRKRCRGMTIALAPDLSSQDVPSLTDVVPLRMIEDREAGILAERILGVGERDGGIVVILIGEKVRAGLLIGGKFFKGEHGQAGNIGAMRTGPDRTRLDDALSLRTYADYMNKPGAEKVSALEDWAEMAASHLKDAIISIGGFLSPGLILVGGDLPDEALDAMVDKVNRQSRRFISSFTVPEVARATFADGGVAEGAALHVFIGDLLPDLSLMGGKADELPPAARDVKLQ